MLEKISHYLHEFKRSLHEEKKDWITWFIAVALLVYSAYVCSTCGGYYKFVDQYGHEIPRQYLIQFVKSYNQKTYGYEDLPIPNFTFSIPPNQTYNGTQD